MTKISDFSIPAFTAEDSEAFAEMLNDKPAKPKRKRPKKQSQKTIVYRTIIRGDPNINSYALIRKYFINNYVGAPIGIFMYGGCYNDFADFSQASEIRQIALKLGLEPKYIAIVKRGPKK